MLNEKEDQTHALLRIRPQISSSHVMLFNPNS